MPAVVGAPLGVVHLNIPVGSGQIVARKIKETAIFTEHSSEMENQNNTMQVYDAKQR